MRLFEGGEEAGAPADRYDPGLNADISRCKKCIAKPLEVSINLVPLDRGFGHINTYIHHILVPAPLSTRTLTIRPAEFPFAQKTLKKMINVLGITHWLTCSSADFCHVAFLAHDIAYKNSSHFISTVLTFFKYTNVPSQNRSTNLSLNSSIAANFSGKLIESNLNECVTW